MRLAITGRQLLGGFQYVSRGFALLGVLLLLISVTPLTAWWARALAGHWDDSSCPVLLVPTGSYLENGILGYSSYWRAVYAVMAYRQSHYEEILISGGGTMSVTPAESMRDFLLASGVPDGVIRLETQSTNTKENAELSARLLAGHDGCVTLLTSDFHMFRAYRLFRRAGLDVRPNPIPDAGKRAARWYTRLDAFLLLCEETVKILYYGARGWI